MARFNVNDADKFGGQGGGGFFSLKNDNDVARVRILYDSIEDVDGLSVHQVDIDGKKRYANCKREYGDPVSSCPFCNSGMFTTVKFFIPLYDVDTQNVVFWERGKKFGAKISSLCARYPHLYRHEFDIERHGKVGDTQTTYEIYEVGESDVNLEDFEVPKVLGGLVLDKSTDEMESYLSTGAFPEEGGSAPIRRRGDSRPTDRRVPPTDRSNRGF